MKKTKVLFLAVLALLGSQILVACSSGQASIADDISVTFSGYSGDGIASYDYNQFYSEIYEISLKKVGLSSKDAKAIAEGDNVVFTRLRADEKSSAKIDQAISMANSVVIELSQTSELSNGDTVVLTVHTSSQESPVKEEVKELTVEGLKEYEVVAMEELVKDSVELKGFDGFGYLAYDSSYFNRPDSYTNLSNGDKIFLEAKASYLEELKVNGKALDTTEYNYTVSGLEDISSLGKIAELEEKVDVYAKSRNQNTGSRTYKLDKQQSYIAYSSGDDTYEGVDELVLATVYKISSKGPYDEDFTYGTYAYTAPIKKDGTLDVANASEKSVSYSGKDLDYVFAALESAGYKKLTQSSSTSSADSDTSADEDKAVESQDEADEASASSETKSSEQEKTSASTDTVQTASNTTSPARWNATKSSQLAQFMVDWGNRMNQPGYVDIYATPYQLNWNGSQLSTSFQASGASDADYTIVAAYEYDRGGGLYHRYHFAILKDGSTAILYSEEAAGGSSLSLSKLNTENAELSNAFLGLVKQ